MVKLSLKKFDMTRITDKSVVVMIGQRNTGKSFLVRDLLFYHQNIPIAMAISGTEESNQFYGHMIPPVFIHHEYQPELLEKYVKRQKMITKKYMKEKDIYGSSKIDPRALLVMDDCLYDKKWTNDTNIRACFLNGRHFHSFFIFTSQYALAAPPILRNNIDFVFILREPRINSRKRIYDNYAGFVPNFDIFNQIMTQCTENYECLVVDNTTKSNKITDQIYWYKASSHEDFRLASKEFWLMQVKEDDTDDDEELADVSTLTTNKRTPNINVQKTLM